MTESEMHPNLRGGSVSLPLNRTKVLEAALWVVDHEGLAQLTMRRVGRRLGFEAMALYRYVTNRDDLLGGVVEFVLDELDDPIDGAEWQATLQEGARNFRHTVLRHINLAPLIAAQALTTPRSEVPDKHKRSMDTVLASLRQAGFSAPDAVLIYRLVTSFTLGHIATHLQYRPEAHTLDPTVSGPDLSNVVELHPSAALDSAALDEDPAEFDVGLAILLYGIVSQIPRTNAK